MIKNKIRGNRINKLILKLILISIGLAFVGLGVALMHKSTLGSSPIDTLSSGVSKKLNISLGMASLIIYLVLFIPCVIFVRNTIKVGTILATFTQGLYINFFYDLIPNIAFDGIPWSKYVISISGIIICSFGISFYVSVNEGLAPLEGITEILIVKFKWSYKKSKTIIDLLLLVWGIILGGVYGLGTLISVLFYGGLIQFFLKRLDPVFKYIQ